MKRLMVILGGGLAVLVLAVAGFFFYALSNLDGIVKGVIESQGTEVAGVPVSVSGVEIKPFDGRGAISGLKVGNPDGFKSDSAVELGGISVAIDTASVTEPVIVIREISVDRPKVTYELAPGGNNIDAIRSNVEKSAGDGSGGTVEPGESEAAGQKLVIELLTIRGGIVRVAASTGLLGDQEIEGTLPDITLRDIGKDSGGATPEQIAEKVMAALTAAASQTAGDLGVGKTLEGLKQNLDALTQGNMPADAEGAKKALEDAGKKLDGTVGEGLKKLFGN
ncbi:hypothetical protein NUH88_15465 [Nisaea acidiphila]|uniref:AsmA domain-containing protein n=1 Tax=Nisaea acidiphila TaxID=1862145 RepID=A0A9J7ANQ5_9PROT|nr:hypothetical protein [Nisaea acidiphila]UUX48798.1 hypothetical protein NUH88_15465 [Nisaea acidiphila]